MKLADQLTLVTAEEALELFGVSSEELPEPAGHLFPAPNKRKGQRIKGIPLYSTQALDEIRARKKTHES